ncbi:Dot/Icm T4SS effector AnkK/LegA5 [Legionella spiritensis]|uniref:Putative Substrate of the Dot/Icm secretion system n=1 Tax=Legionella spiritensis TaxID=452 RepID=A0A0W0ZAJ9_LEGSP|nr:Dot/Icm T4SS effector AnkK/LegA5 [Legionella spiritensis]KTD66151.1 putative Substrate of the Dot/Icm secretion system [Legionella spiritensis]SNV43912.1 substrate of the Dot/Icm secretion system [Legionella spiritensis]
MPGTLKFENLTLGNESRTGHVVYTKALYRNGTGAKRVVYKENKYNDPFFSHLEVAFGGLAKRFLRPGLTCGQWLVSDHENVTGLLSEHMIYPVAKHSAPDATFYKLVREGKNQIRISHFVSPKPEECEEFEEFEEPEELEKSEKCSPEGSASDLASTPEKDIPIYFLNQFAPGFFASLLAACEQGKILFDFDSLASVLTTSYTLEEDDLHKGNFGFYLINDGGKPKVVFFKIDHDLMLSDSIMSHGYARVANWRHGTNAFAVTRRDLLHFPRLYDSRNYYWPTCKRTLANPIDYLKTYTNPLEIDAFIRLGTIPEFQKAKWLHFYKHTLIPPSIIAQSLSHAYDGNNASDRAQMALITNMVVARQAKLRAVLFSLPEFREFVETLSETDKQRILDDILVETEGGKQETRISRINKTILNHQQLCQSEDGFQEGDTPLHTAIRLGDYRYHETWDAFKQFAGKANKSGEKPLDVAVKMAQGFEGENGNDPRNNSFLIIKHLLNQGVSQTKSYRSLDKETKDKITNYRFRTIHMRKAVQAKDYEAIVTVLRDVGEDKRFSLKMKKELSLACMETFLARNTMKPAQLREVLLQLKTSLNGDRRTRSAPAPELQYIRQLRSELWIVRQIRGLLGGTSTKIAFNDLLDKKIAALSPPCYGCFSFFMRTQSPAMPEKSPVSDSLRAS